MFCSASTFLIITVTIMVDITDSDADLRALRRAHNAEAQRRQHADRVRAEEEFVRRRARLEIPGVIERESAR